MSKRHRVRWLDLDEGSGNGSSFYTRGVSPPNLANIIALLNGLGNRTVYGGDGLTNTNIIRLRDGDPVVDLGTPSTNRKSSANAVTADSHTHDIEEVSDGSTQTGTANEIVSTDANGQLKVSRAVAHEYMESPLWQSLDSVSDDTTVQPTGDHILDPGTGDVVPGTDVAVDHGTFDHYFLEAHYARGLFGVLPADGSQTGIGGTLRSTGAGVTFLTRDLAVDATTMYANANAFEDGEFVVLHNIIYSESVRAEQFEVIEIDSAGSLEGAGDYSYTVIRAAYGTLGGVEFGTGGISYDMENDFDTWYNSFQPSNNPFLALVSSGSGAAESGLWYAGAGVVSLGASVGAGILEWTSQDYVEGGAGPGFAGWRRSATTNWDDLLPFFMVGNGNGYGDYTADEMIAGMAVDLSQNPGASEFEGFLVDSTAARMGNVFSRWYNAVNDEIISISALAGFKLGTDVSAAATTVLDFDPDNGDMLIGRAATDRLSWTNSTEVMQFLGLLTASRYTYQKMLDIGKGSVPNGETDGVNVFWDDTDGWVYIKDDSGALQKLNTDSTRDLDDIKDVAPADGNVLTWVNANSQYEAKTAQLVVPQTLAVYIDVKERQAEQNIFGNLAPQFSTGDPLDSVNPINFTHGIGKLVIIVNAGSDLAGEITITGTSVDRNTGAETPADTDTITVDALTTDNGTTDSNGNAVHEYLGAYITSKWFRGSVVLSTTDLTLTDVDVFGVSFDQFGDYANIEVDTFDVTSLANNTAAWCDLYLYGLVVTGDKCAISAISDVHVSTAESEADRYYRLRRGNLAETMDGTKDGIWVDGSYGPFTQKYWEDITIFVRFNITVPVTFA